MEPPHTSPVVGSALRRGWWQHQWCLRVRDAPCCGAGNGPAPSLSQCCLWTVVRAARGVWPCCWAAVSPHPTRCNPGKALQPLPLSTFPLARRSRARKALVPGAGSPLPHCSPFMCLVRAMSTHPPPHCAPHSVQHHSLCLHRLCLIPWDPWLPSRLWQPPALAPSLGWLGPMALAVGALQGWHPASCPPVPSRGRDLWAHESDSEPKGNQEHCHGGTYPLSLTSGRVLCPGHCTGSCGKD